MRVGGGKGFQPTVPEDRRGQMHGWGVMNDDETLKMDHIVQPNTQQLHIDDARFDETLMINRVWGRGRGEGEKILCA